MAMTSELNLRHLRALPVIIAVGSLSGAAEAAGMSQPALTQGLATLEARVGGTLLSRHHDGVRPTRAGLILAARVEAALAALSTAAGLRTDRGFAQPDRLMTMTQLQAFLGLAEHGSFAAAGRAEGRSQSSLHRAVRDLAMVIGCPLAERQGRRMVLTGAGRRLARAMRLCMGELAAALAEIAGEGAPTRIAIGAMPLSRSRLVPLAVTRFVAARPGTTVEVVDGGWRDLAEQLRDGRIDLMIGALRDPALHPDLTQAPLFDDHLAVVGRAGHPLTGSRRVDREALCACPWIVGRVTSPVRRRWERAFGDHGARAAVECGSLTAIRGMLAASDMLALLSPDQVRLEVTAGMLAMIGAPLEGEGRRIGVISREDWRPTAEQRHLVSLLQLTAAN